MTTTKTIVHAIRWVEDKETFHLVALSSEVAEEGYKDNTKFDHTSRREIELVFMDMGRVFSRRRGLATGKLFARCGEIAARLAG